MFDLFVYRRSCDVVDYRPISYTIIYSMFAMIYEISGGLLAMTISFARLNYFQLLKLEF